MAKREKTPDIPQMPFDDALRALLSTPHVNDALHEILDLRRRNELLQAKVEVVNVFAAALLGPQAKPGMTIDVAWALQQKLRELEAAVPSPKVAA